MDRENRYVQLTPAIVTMSPLRSSLIYLGNLGLSGTSYPITFILDSTNINRQIRQGTANNTKGTVFVVYEDVTDAKQACDKLNGFNFQNRYLVGEWNEKATNTRERC